MEPAAVALISSSIFMDSMMITVWPEVTCAPSATAKRMMVPVTGAAITAPPEGAAATGAGDPIRLAAREETQRLYEPEPRRRREYDAIWHRYETLSRGLRALHNELKAH